MIVTCEQCGTKYQLPSERIKPNGSTVRCSKCHNTFVALPPHDDMDRFSESSVPVKEHEFEPTSPSTAVSTQSEDVQLPDLAGEIDRIFCADESGGELFSSNKEEEPIVKAAPNRFSEDIETLDLSELDDDLNQLLDKDYQAKEKSTGSDTVQNDGLESELDNLEDVVLDENQIGSLDLKLENLDELESRTDEIRPKKRSDQRELPVLDTNLFESLDLELETAEDPTHSNDTKEKNKSLDTNQIKSLSIDLESIDDSQVPEPSVSDDELKENSTFDKGITLDIDREKTADILNLNLERPDLGGHSDSDGDIDLPILDELLAPADVTDASLIDESPDMTAETKPDSTDESSDLTIEPESDILDEPLNRIDDSKPDIDEKLMAPMEKVFPDDSQPTLELESIDQKLNVEEKDVESEEVQTSFPAEPEITPPAEREVQVDTTAEETVTAIGATAETAKPEKLRTLPRRRTRKWVIAPLVIVLLLAAMLGTNALGVRIPDVSDWLGDMNIPFLSDSGQSRSDDPGNARIKTTNIDSKFIHNNKNGPLFVITGKVLNQYDDTRVFIQIKGSIYASGGRLVESKSVHCGNILTDVDLAAKSFDDIQRYLTDNLGTGEAGTLNVKPGQSLPFMIVFAGLPPDIEEFSVEVIDSAAL